MDDIDERYENAKIYKLESNVSDLFYIGSTINSLARRLQLHENNYRAYQKGTYRSYCSSFAVLDTGDYSISLYNEYPCQNKMQLEIEEGVAVQYYMQYAGCVNRYIPGICARLGGRKQYMKELYKIIHCKCGGTYHDYITARKLHFETKIHQYWIEHREVKPKKNESIHCECGGQYIKRDRARHFRRLRHQKYLASQE